jgi:small subunit ribosomal protein S16
MATRIRLQRHGRKGRAIFHIVTADTRAKRDGKFIEKLGIYNPNTNPATIDLNFERALYWVQNGAVPSDTARAILSYKGILMKKHLLDGVTKGALTLEQAEEKFTKWADEKEGRISTKRESLSTASADEKAKKLEAEAEVSRKRAEAIAAANAPALVEEVATEETVEAAAEEAPEASAEATEASAEAPKTEE